MPPDLADVLRVGLRRVRSSLPAMAEAAVAAAVAWYITHDVLHHPQPFFAPIAAGITMGTTHTGRPQRIVQLIVGVLLGIAIAQGMTAAFGKSAVVLGVTVLATLTAATVIGAGFADQGPLFTNQAMASAILFVTLRGTGSDRTVDAVVGSGVALALVVLLFPSEPFSLLRRDERQLLDGLVENLHRTRPHRDPGADGRDESMNGRARKLRQQLEVLSNDESTAQAISWMSPRRWSARAAVSSEISRLAALETIVDVTLALDRFVATIDPEARRALPDQFESEISELATAVGMLARVQPPWPTALLQDVRLSTHRILTLSGDQFADPSAALRGLLSAAAINLDVLTENTPKPG
jgi:uncharacterized membrane protein YgaE (UPF0421/DUF939 family)